MRPRDRLRFLRRCDLLGLALTSDLRHPDGMIVWNALLVAECDAGGWWRLAWRVLKIACWYEWGRGADVPWRVLRWWLVRRGVLVSILGVLHRRNCSDWACDSSCVGVVLPWWARWAAVETGEPEERT